MKQKDGMYPCEYPNTLKDNGFHNKANAFIGFYNDFEFGRDLDHCDYADIWKLGIPEAIMWIENFRHEIDRYWKAEREATKTAHKRSSENA